MDKSKIPVPVTVISIFYFISAFLVLAAGVASIFLSWKNIDLIGLGPSPETLMVVGIIALVISVLYIFVGKDLLRGKKWARTAVIVLSGIASVENLILIFGNVFLIIPLAINIAILLYLLLNRDAKKSFSKR